MNARKTFGICLAVLVVGGALPLIGDLCRGPSADAATDIVRPVGVLPRVQGSEAITDPSAIGRFQITCGPLSRQDIYLLDTANGETWEMHTDRESQKRWWSVIPRR